MGTSHKRTKKAVQAKKVSLPVKIADQVFVIRHTKSHYNEAWNTFDKTSMTYSMINHNPKWLDSLPSKTGRE